MKNKRHYIVFDSSSPNEFLKIAEIAGWQARHDSALIICNTIYGLDGALTHFPHHVVLVSLANRRKAADACLYLRRAGVPFIIIPENWLPVDFYDSETLDPVDPELILARPLTERGFARTYRVVNWGELIDTLSSL